MDVTEVTWRFHECNARRAVSIGIKTAEFYSSLILKFTLP